ncbi:MAG: CooT family nickel-binding protein [Lachnospiraceae bacterium]|nr:CooT family nickel-binding protein [Lachnospiraceae bacterium]MBQ6242476.1 CooT family nickel-binding protein [Lachnospiraceae bacterium]
MCLSNIYRASDNQLLMDNTARIEVRDGTVILRDLFGRVLKVPGQIASVDLENNIVVLQTEDCEK